MDMFAERLGAVSYRYRCFDPDLAKEVSPVTGTVNLPSGRRRPARLTGIPGLLMPDGDPGAQVLSGVRTEDVAHGTARR
jgi:hypothetical protein